MMSQVDLLIVGAGPAGMAAAIAARKLGLTVLVVDEQPEPGGQIWRGIERVGRTSRASILGAAYTEGLAVAARFRACGAEFSAETSLWHIEDGPVAYLKASGVAHRLEPRCVLLATGAQERPTPFEGWTLPGVMTVGAGQILLKSAGQVPEDPVWIAGTGPLAYLYAVQLLDAGARIAGFLDTRPKGRIRRNLDTAIAALYGQPKDILKGLAWLAKIRRHCCYVPHIVALQGHGQDRLERITFQTQDQRSETVEAQHLLVHEGIVPTVHPTMALDCRHDWNPEQGCYQPFLDSWGETSRPYIFGAGDLAGIAGAKAALLRGEIAAIGIALKLGKRSATQAEVDAAPLRRRLAKATSVRAFLDKVYRPREMALLPTDQTLVCRCEEISAGRIRDLCRVGQAEPNRIKAFSRAGMGPCQGRMCNYPVASVLADAMGSDASEIGLYRVRPPFKPLTLDELAQLQMTEGMK